MTQTASNIVPPDYLSRLNATLLIDDADEAMAAFKKLDREFWCEEFNAIRCAVLFQLVWQCTESEATLQEHFFRNLETLLPGAVKVSRKSMPGGFCDGFVQYQDGLCPVEVKKHGFDNSAKEQLRGYMRAYGARLGIAVARELRTLLPPDMIFVRVSTR